MAKTRASTEAQDVMGAQAQMISMMTDNATQWQGQL